MLPASDTRPQAQGRSPGRIRPGYLILARPGTADEMRPPPCPVIYTGVAVFLGGLKNGKVVTFTLVFSRMASIVISICSDVPGFAYSRSTLARAINFFKTGDQLVVVALPACLSPE